MQEEKKKIDKIQSICYDGRRVLYEWGCCKVHFAPASFLWTEI